MIVHRYGTGFAGGLAAGLGLGLGVALGGAVAALYLVRRRTQQFLKPAYPRHLEKWDYDMELLDLDGKYIYGSTFRGRVLFLNFWATWCTPCVAEMPSIERLLTRLTDTTIAFACVTKESSEVTHAFLRQRSISLPVYCGTGPRSAFFDTSSLPATFVVSSDGTICFRHEGAARWDSDEMVVFLRELAAD